jgi:TM2 domain-containing membrane protein YozV
MSEETPNPEPVQPQAPQTEAPAGGGYSKEQKDKKLLAGILGILLGGLGIHKFILGYTKEGIIQIVITVITCGIGSLIGLIEGIIYLTKTDDEFVSTYVVGRKGWF